MHEARKAAQLLEAVMLTDSVAPTEMEVQSSVRRIIRVLAFFNAQPL